MLDGRQLFVLATLPEGSWFGDFNAFFDVTSAFTYVAHYEEDKKGMSQPGDDHYRIMMLMCPVDKFIALLQDYPQTYKWMMSRSLIRRNYFIKIQSLYNERHDVHNIFNHPRYANRNITEDERELLHEKV